MGIVLFISYLILIASVAALAAIASSQAKTIRELRYTAMGLKQYDSSGEKDAMVWLSEEESIIERIIGGDYGIKLLFKSVSGVVMTVGPVYLLAREMLDQGFNIKDVMASISVHFLIQRSSAHANAVAVLVSFMMSGMVRLEKDKELRIWARSNGDLWPIESLTSKTAKRLMELVLHSLDKGGGPEERNATSDAEREAWKIYRAMSKRRAEVMGCWSM